MRGFVLAAAIAVGAPLPVWADSSSASAGTPAVAQNETPQKKRRGAAAKNVKNDKNAKNDTSPRDRKNMPPGLTPEREAAAMTFVRQHHEELVSLLRYLKAEKPQAYRQAVLDLFRASERLAHAQERDYDRYELELAIWKTESRIELLAARVKMAGRDSPEGRALLPQLEQLLKERHDLKMQRLAHERQRSLERLERIEKQLETMDANRASAIERELSRLTAPAKK